MGKLQYWDGNVTHDYSDGDELTSDEANAIGLRAIADQLSALNVTLKGLLHHFEENETTVHVNH